MLSREALRATLILFLRAVHPAAPVGADAPQIIEAIVTAVRDDLSAREAPVFGSPEADAEVLGYTAWKESGMRLHAIGDHGRSFGAFQLQSEAGKGDPLTQAKGALGAFRKARDLCPESPMRAYMSGGCVNARRLAARRMHEVVEAMKTSQRANPGAILGACDYVMPPPSSPRRFSLSFLP